MGVKAGQRAAECSVECIIVARCRGVVTVVRLLQAPAHELRQSDESVGNHQKLRRPGPRRRLVMAPRRAVQCRRLHQKQAMREQPLRNKVSMRKGVGMVVQFGKNLYLSAGHVHCGELGGARG